jgi:predicted nucleic acid-binding protein
VKLESLFDAPVYLDANVFIYGVEAFPAYEGAVTAVFQAIREGTIHAVTSELAIAEVLVLPLRERRLDLVATYDRLLRPRQSFEISAVTRSILRDSAQLRAELGGKLPDAIHAATAVTQACGHFLTADRKVNLPVGPQLVLLDQIAST